MKLLLDQNLSPKLASRLADAFPGSSHVYLLGLGTASDNEVWNFARDSGFTLVTKDAEFSDMSMLRAYPPKELWLRIGNCTTAQVEALVRYQREAIGHFESDPAVCVLSLS